MVGARRPEPWGAEADLEVVVTKLFGRVALISGGARGQGAAEAAALVAAGARVVVADVLDDDGYALADRLGDDCSFMHLDVTDADNWAEVVGRVAVDLADVGILVNNAGIFRSKSLLDTDRATWDQVIAVNQTSVLLGMQAVAPGMKANGAGSIVNTSSIAGLTGAGTIGYTASKWAVRGMTRAAARELAPHGIRVNSVLPGFIETPMMSEITPEQLDALTRAVPMGRRGTSEEVAQLVVFLASDDSLYITGAEHVIDGGWYA